jgi:hypothetical protein
MSGAFIMLFNDLAIENTEAAHGYHRRIVVYDDDGKRIYGISFGMKNDNGDMFQFEPSAYGAEFGKKGEGIVYPDYKDGATKIVGVLKTNSAENMRIVAYMQSQVGKTGPYHLLFNNCRDYSDKQFDYIYERVLSR